MGSMLTEDERMRRPKLIKWLCGSVGRVVASDIRDLRFESSHRQKLVIYIEHLFTVNFVLQKTKIKKRRLGMAHFYKKN